MKLRSMLLVPGDRPDQMAAAMDAGADAVILDLGESISPNSKGEARRAVADILSRNPGRSLWVRIHPLDDPEVDRDLATIIGARPDGIVLPGSEGGPSVAELARRLTERGNVSAMILPMATDTGSSIFHLGSYVGVKRLAALGWGWEQLATSLGATIAYEEGGWTAPFEIARSLCLFGASAAGVPAIETMFPDVADVDGLTDFASRARRDGFSGMIAIDPVQVPAINEIFA